MAWTASLDKPVVAESPMMVAYVTLASDDNRTISKRVPYENESDLLDFLAQECQRLTDLDARVAAASLRVGPIALPDVSKQRALQDATQVRDRKVFVALEQKRIADAIALDPTVADAQSALDAALAALSAKD